MVVAPFNYAVLPHAVRSGVAEAAREIRVLAYRTARDMIRAGELIRGVRRSIKARTFRRWLDTELPWSKSHSYRLMQVAEVFGPLLEADSPRIEPTALYMLARPEAPPAARAYAAELAVERLVTAADAREILDAHRRTPDPTREEVREYTERTKPLRDAEPKPAKPVGPTAEDALRVWSALEAMVDRSTMLHVSRIDEGGEALFSVTVHAEGDRPRNVVRRVLVDAILSAAGLEQEKWCPGCGRSHPVGLFGINAQMRDGLNRRCKACERPRLAAAKKAKKRPAPENN